MLLSIDGSDVDLFGPLEIIFERFKTCLWSVSWSKIRSGPWVQRSSWHRLMARRRFLVLVQCFTHALEYAHDVESGSSVAIHRLRTKQGVTGKGMGKNKSKEGI